jgi:hypothetical protein
MSDTQIQADIEKVSYIHAAPSAGKSFLAANMILDGHKVVDTDLITDWFIPYDQKMKLIDMKVPPWKSREAIGWLWQSLMKSVVMVAIRISEATNCTIITNIIVSDLVPKQIFADSWTVFRKPEDLANLYDARSNRGDGIEITSMAKVAKSWYEGWTKHNERYHHAVTLEPYQYLSDLFGIENRITNNEEAWQVIYQHMTKLVAGSSFSYMLPKSKSQTEVKN